MEKNNGIARITLNNPGSLNSLIPPLLSEMLIALEEMEHDQAIRVVIITGAGKGFSVGGDLSYLRTLNTISESRKYVQDAAAVAMKIVDLPKPVIAMVNGVTAGAGVSLALACDIVFCANSVRFLSGFGKVGLISDMGGAYLLTRAMGLHKAKEFMFSAQAIDAESACRLGMVNRVVGNDCLLETTYKFAEELLKCAPVALRLMKKILNSSEKLDFPTIVEIETAGQVYCIGTADHKEALAAMKEKRDPVFKGL